MSSTANRVIKNTGYLYAKMAITMFVSLYTTRLVLKGLGATDFGVFNVVGGAIAMLGFLNAAMSGATQRFISFSEGAGDSEKKKEIFSVSIIIHAAISVFVVLGLLLLGLFLFDGILNIPEGRMFATKVVYGSMIISTSFSIATVPYDAVLNAHENMKYYAVVGLVESFLKLSVAFICVYTSYDRLVVYGILMACIPFITLTIERAYCNKKYEECKIKVLKYWNVKTMKEMTSFAGWNLLGTCVSMLSNSGMGIVMNMFFGPVVNAAQGVAQQISGQLMSITTVMAKAVNPVMVKTAGRGDKERLFQMSYTSSKVFFFLCSFVALPAMAVMSELMNLWLHDVPPFAVFFAQCQLLLFLFNQIVSGVNTVIIANGNIKFLMVSQSVIKIIYLPIIYVLFKFGFGVIYAYIILLLLQGVINQLIITIYSAYKVLGYNIRKYYIKVFLKAAIPFILVLFLEFEIGKYCYGISKILIICSTSLLIYTILYCFITLSQVERQMLYRILNSLKQKMMTVNK